MNRSDGVDATLEDATIFEISVIVSTGLSLIAIIWPLRNVEH